MFESQVVLLKIGAMFVVMLAGWWASRRGYLDLAISRALSVLVVQIAFPALVFTQMLSTVSAPALRAGWWIPLLAIVSIALAGQVGRLLARGLGIDPARRRTFVFVVAVPNWVFLPLPIAEALYGADGVRFVLLFNFGAQVILWTEGIRTLVGGGFGRDAVRGLLANPGIVATLAGAAIALAWPGAGSLGQRHDGGSLLLVADGVVGALRMLGDLTIPLSLLVTGAQLGNLAKTGAPDVKALAGAVVGRLVIAPAVTVLLLRGVTGALGVHMLPADFVTTAIIVSMPVAISCSMFVEQYGGDRGISAASIFYTTLLSLVTVPLVVLICRAWV
jgi:predicted permease